MAYAIYEGNLEKIRKKVTRIKNKCAKFGTDFRFEEVGEEYREFEGDDGETIIRRFVLVEAEGVAKINGWRFIASVEHTEKGNIISKAVDDIEVPARYYDSAPFCEHCGTDRTRKYTFIVMSDAGEFKQVGKSCLTDFTGGMSVDGVALYASFFDDLIEAEEPHEGSGGSGRFYIKRDTWLAYVAECVLHLGYVKSSEPDSTRGKALDFYELDHGRIRMKEHAAMIRREEEQIGFNPENPEAVKMAADALAWLDEQGGDSNFMHNLKTVCALDYIDGYAHSGVAAALFPTWRKDLERKEEARRQAEADKASEWVGKVGDRITIEMESAFCVTGWETEWGYVGIYKITDTNGNIFTWKTSGAIDEKDRFITGTVKAHNEFRGTKQTELTRCKCKR